LSDVRLVLAGDVAVSRPDPESAFVSALPYLRDSDIRFCNLEVPVFDTALLPSHYIKRVGPPIMDEWMFKSLVDAGFNVMSQANNPNTYHDVGVLIRSLEVLDDAGIVRGGAGLNLAEARKPAVIERCGTKVAFVCRTSVGDPRLAATTNQPGVAFYPIHTTYEPSPRLFDHPGFPPIVRTQPARGEDRDQLEKDIHEAHASADVVIVAWHWGLHYWQISPDAGPGDVEILEYQRELAHTAVEFGADMVVGTGSCYPQPIEVYRGVPIAYGLGSFVLDEEFFSRNNSMGLLLRCVIRDGEIARLAFVGAMTLEYGQPQFDRPDRTAEVVSLVRELSSPFGTQFKIEEEDVEVVLSA
jgi:hypothetical protein